MWCLGSSWVLDISCTVVGSVYDSVYNRHTNVKSQWKCWKMVCNKHCIFFQYTLHKLTYFSFYCRQFATTVAVLHYSKRKFVIQYATSRNLCFFLFFYKCHCKLVASPCWKWRFFWLLFKRSVQGGDVFTLLPAIFWHDFFIPLRGPGRTFRKPRKTSHNILLKHCTFCPGFKQVEIDQDYRYL